MKKSIAMGVALMSMVILSSCGLQKAENREPIKGAAMMRQDDNTVQKEDDAMIKKDKTVTENDSVMVQKEVGYTDYSDATLDAALANGQKVALFFHASWCPTCKALDASLKSGSIPSDLIILKVDYDTSTELKKKYGVTSQHTIVALDAQKNMVKKEVGSQNIAAIVALF